MFPERSDATRIAASAHGPRLLGVPVPARAFGFASGWQLSSRCWSTIDLRDQAVSAEQDGERQIEDAVRVMCKGMDAVQQLMRTAAVPTTVATQTRATRGYARSHRPASKTNAIEKTTEVEVAAA